MAEDIAAENEEGGRDMIYGLRRGRNNRGGSGFAFRGASPLWPYIGRGRGGLPRCQSPEITAVTREQELDFLKKQAEAMKSELNRIESRMSELQEGDQ